MIFNIIKSYTLKNLNYNIINYIISLLINNNNNNGPNSI